MKFTRRPDLDPHTRIEIVRLAWLYQGIEDVSKLLICYLLCQDAKHTHDG